MLKTLKWAYKLGYDRAKQDVFRVLEREREFHLNQSQIKSLQKADDKYDLYKDRVVTAEEHEQRYQEVNDILSKLDPEKYPDIDKWVEMMK